MLRSCSWYFIAIILLVAICCQDATARRSNALNGVPNNHDRRFQSNFYDDGDDFIYDDDDDIYEDDDTFDTGRSDVRPNSVSFRGIGGVGEQYVQANVAFDGMFYKPG